MKGVALFVMAYAVFMADPAAAGVNWRSGGTCGGGWFTHHAEAYQMLEEMQSSQLASLDDVALGEYSCVEVPVAVCTVFGMEMSESQIRPLARRVLIKKEKRRSFEGGSRTLLEVAGFSSVDLNRLFRPEGFTTLNIMNWRMNFAHFRFPQSDRFYVALTETMSLNQNSDPSQQPLVFDEFEASNKAHSVNAVMSVFKCVHQSSNKPQESVILPF